jgi:glycosyltransferase involved in cell wall biosynthesis
MLEKKFKTLYLHGRPGAHPLHKAFALAVDSDFMFVDRIMRWQDKTVSIYYKIISSFLNAMFFPITRYQFILVDNLHFAPIFAKKLRVFSKKKYIVHLGSHTLYFMYTGRFSKFVNKLHLWALKNYDFIICEGEMAKEIVLKLNPELASKIHVNFLGPKQERHSDLNNVKYNPNSKQLLILAGGPGEFRMHYKGLDIMIKAFARLYDKDNDLKLAICGDWDDQIRLFCLKDLNEICKNSITFYGIRNDINTFFGESVLLIHCSRGDAFPTSTVEAMTAGLPVLLSDWTGTKEIVQQVSNKLIVSLDEFQIAENIYAFLNLSEKDKLEISDKFRKVSLNYTEEKAVEKYRNIFTRIKSES